MENTKWIQNGEFEGMKGIILASRGGARNADNLRNPDYKMLRDYILELFIINKVKNVEIYIAAKSSSYSTLESRQIIIDNKKVFDFENIEITDFKTKLNKAVKESGQGREVKSGGNDTKRLFFKTDLSITNNVDLRGEAEVSIEKLESLLKDFPYEFDNDQKDKVKILQDNLLNHFSINLDNYIWEKEYIPFSPFSDRRDRFDIYGYNKVNNHHIVIELDPHRADSISKKFVSRLALMHNKKMTYIAFIYPGTQNMSISESEKYLNDCKLICNEFNNDFIGYFYTNNK